LDPEYDAPTLAHLSRCSRVCHQLVIPILYSHIHFYTDRQVARLLSDLSLIEGDDGQALPCSTLTEIPTNDGQGKVGRANATRKLSHLLHTRYVSLHFLPDPSAIEIDPHMYGAPSVWVQRSGTGKLENFQHRLFPRVRGVALGKGFIPDFLNWIADDHDFPCDDPAHRIPQNRGVDTGDQPCLGHFPGITLFIELFRVTPPSFCWNMDDIPPGVCDQVQLDMVRSLVDDTWGEPFAINTHSTFPRIKLAPWGGAELHWRHFIAVGPESWRIDTDEAGGSRDGGGYADQCDGTRRCEEVASRAGRDEGGHSDPLGDEAFEEDSDTDHTHSWDDDGDADSDADSTDSESDIHPELPEDRLLLRLAEDVYSIATKALRSLAMEDKPRRRNLVYSGLTSDHVRRLEQTFVKIVRRRSPHASQVIVNPSRARRGEFGLNGNREGDGGLDREEDDAVREHQKRVLTFDFFHGADTTNCEVCGGGDGRVRRGQGDTLLF